jgi:hypothetical protein
MRHNDLSFAALLLTAAGTTTNAAAEEAAAVGFAGVHSSFSSQDAYVGFLMPSWGGRLGSGWFVRVVGNTVAYRYDTRLSGLATRVHAKAAGLQVGAGRAWSLDDLSLELSSSLAARRTRLTPDDPANSAGQTVQWAPVPELAARYRMTPRVDADVFANMGLGWGDRYLRARLGAQPATGWRSGLAAVSNQGPTYHDRSVGVFASTSPTAGWWIEIDAGRSRARDGRTGAYWRVSASWQR